MIFSKCFRLSKVNKTLNLKMVRINMIMHLNFLSIFTLFKEFLSTKVEFVKIRSIMETHDGPKPSIVQSIFYIIKNDECVYVGAIHDIKHDLHF